MTQSLSGKLAGMLHQTNSGKYVMARAGVSDALLAGLLLAMGTTSLILASPLAIGEVSRMGPGFLPHAVSIILMGLSAMIGVRAIVVLRGKTDEPAGEPIPWRGLLYVSAAILSFALLVRPGGLIVASSLAVLLCASADIASTWRERILLAGGFAGAAVAIFVFGLGLPLSLYPTLS